METGDSKHILIKAPKLTAQQKKIAATIPLSLAKRQDKSEKASTADQKKFYANTGGVTITNYNIWLISQERKDRKEMIITVLHKKKTKFGIGIAVFVYDFVNGDAEIITNNGELSILIQLQLWKQPKGGTTKPKLISTWLNLREKMTFKPGEWTLMDNFNLVTM